MNQNIINEINRQGYIKRNRSGNFIYNIPEDRQIQIGDETNIDGIYLPEVEGYNGRVFCRISYKKLNVNLAIDIDVFSDEIGNKILNILEKTNITKTYQSNTADLCTILNDMISYIQSTNDGDYFNNAYLEELSNTGIFHDAIGEVVESGEDYVEVAEEY